MIGSESPASEFVIVTYLPQPQAQIKLQEQGVIKPPLKDWGSEFAKAMSN